MKRNGNSSRRPRLRAAALCAAIFVASACAAPGPAAARAASSPELKPGERVIEVDPTPRRVTQDSDWLSVTEIRVGGQSVTPGRPFAADADWLRTLTMRVRNDSAKPITFVQFHFWLPETRHQTGLYGFIFTFNRLLLGGGVSSTGKEQLLPGEEAELSFEAGKYDWVRASAEQRYGAGDLTRLWIGQAHLVFADGTRGYVSKPAWALRPASADGGAK